MAIDKVHEYFAAPGRQPLRGRRRLLQPRHPLLAPAVHIGSQLVALRERVTAEGHDLVAEFVDDGHSGARLDRPGLDALRDSAEAGLIDAMWCLSPDRLARIYAYQVIVLDELARHGVAVCFADAPAIDDDPQSRLLTQVQGVIAEYERAKIAERYRRGKLWRSRSGEVLAWRIPYGYRRIARSATGPAHLEIYEPEAAVVRRIFDDYVAAGHSTREITRRLNADSVPTPSGKAVWGTSTIGRLLHNEAYVGRVYWNKTESVPDPRPGRRNRQVPRPREDWITIAVPAIVSDDTFDATSRVTRDNSKGAPATPSPVPGCCAASSAAAAAASGSTATGCAAATAPATATTTAATTTRCAPAARTDAARSGTFAPTSSTPSSSTRSATPCCRPDVLLAGEHAVAARAPAPDDELLAAHLSRLDRGPTPPWPNATVSSISTRPGSSSSSKCNAEPKNSTPDAPPSTNNAGPSPSNAPRSPRTTVFDNASARSPNEPPQPSTASTSINARSCCASSSTRSASPAGTSRPNSVSPSTTSPPNHPPDADHDHHEATTTTRRQCQAMTVCVPLVTTTGDSYRLTHRTTGGDT